MPLRVLHLSTYDALGGAARAAHAVHRSLVDAGVDSRMIVARKETQDPTVQQRARHRQLVTSDIDRRIGQLEKSPLKTWRSPARCHVLSARQINSSTADIVNLHWVTHGFMSIEEIGKITKPVVWSMYDMWPFAGTEHYCPDTPEARWRTGYTRENRPADEAGLDIDRWTYERKFNLWTGRRPFHMVPASTWLAEATKQSQLMGSWPITRIPHVVSDQEFAPMEKAAARAKIGLPSRDPIILFLASAGIHDQRKGFDLLEQALVRIAPQVPGLKVAIAGPPDIGYRSQSGAEFIWLGHLDGNAALRAAYCAADVVAAPSREDNMPLTAMEAHTCGTPVVAFNIGGLPDIVTHGETGYLAAAFDTSDLATGLSLSLNDVSRTWGMQATRRAVSEWSPAVIARRYSCLYAEVLAGK